MTSGYLSIFRDCTVSPVIKANSQNIILALCANLAQLPWQTE